MCSVANKDIQKHRGTKHRVELARMVIIITKVQKCKRTLARVNLLHGCSITNVPLIEASSKGPIFNTRVQKASKPRLGITTYHQRKVSKAEAILEQNSGTRPVILKSIQIQTGLGSGQTTKITYIRQ